MILLDTNIAILIMDGDRQMLDRLSGSTRNAISVITRVELEAGVFRHEKEQALAAARLDVFLMGHECLFLRAEEADAYRHILTATGFSRRKLLDRLIAATALVHGLPLATLNPADFADVPGLEVLDWGVPA
ncbi:PIN domain-containing protein [Sandaracinobacteroides hominis]|uniref:PIN domain-containing protein n=1 Tax=Sandaracinobacteroides hominis TaxID=2780086 RepID=UPI0018F7A9AD|nr:PIN domain-containing protein [Sandaracinobacteroides hominis]